MKRVTHLLRIKKNNPKYELYEVKDNKAFFLEEANELINIDINHLFLRIVLSTSLCIEGERSFEEKGKQIKIIRDQFYFNHQIISNHKDLIFSRPKIFQSKLRQLWMNIDEYNKIILPIIKKYHKKIESIISEKSSFIVNKNQIIELFDNKNLSILKLNENGSNEIVIAENTQKISNSSYHGLFLNDNIKNCPNLKNDKSKLNLLTYFMLVLFFLIINIFIIYINTNPIYSLKINYFFTEMNIKRVENPDKIIELENLLRLNLKKNLPQEFNFFNDFLNLFPDKLLSNLIETEFSKDRGIKLKFDTNAMKDIMVFINNNKGLNIKIEPSESYILLIKDL